MRLKEEAITEDDSNDRPRRNSIPTPSPSTHKTAGITSRRDFIYLSGGCSVRRTQYCYTLNLSYVVVCQIVTLSNHPRTLAGS